MEKLVYSPPFPSRVFSKETLVPWCKVWGLFVGGLTQSRIQPPPTYPQTWTPRAPGSMRTQPSTPQSEEWAAQEVVNDRQGIQEENIGPSANISSNAKKEVPFYLGLIYGLSNTWLFGLFVVPMPLTALKGCPEAHSVSHTDTHTRPHAHAHAHSLMVVPSSPPLLSEYYSSFVLLQRMYRLYYFMLNPYKMGKWLNENPAKKDVLTIIPVTEIHVNNRKPPCP